MRRRRRNSIAILALAISILCLAAFLRGRAETLPLWAQLKTTRSQKPVSASTMYWKTGASSEETILDRNALFLIEKPIAEVRSSLAKECADRHMTSTSQDKWTGLKADGTYTVIVEPANSSKTFVTIDDQTTLTPPNPTLWARIETWLQNHLP